MPSYIASSPQREAAVIFAPGSPDVHSAAYKFPDSPILYFFEGGSYRELALQAISGDEFIGGAASGYSEPAFNDGGTAGGIDAGNDSYGYSGGSSTLSSSADVGTTTVTTATAIPGYISYITFADGSTYGISARSGNSIKLSSSLRSTEALGSSVWANSNQPIAEVSKGAAQGSNSVTLTELIDPSTSPR